MSRPKWGGLLDKLLSKSLICQKGQKQAPRLDNFGFSKLPKTQALLCVFFHHLLQEPALKCNSNSLTLATTASITSAALKTVALLKDVWQHHFGLLLVHGKRHRKDIVDRESSMIISDRKIVAKLESLFKVWRELERMSRRSDRQHLYMKRADEFREQLQNPFNILKHNGEQILCQSGIKLWEEELTHLRNQMDPKQVGCCDGYDQRQKKKEEREIREKASRDAAIEKSKNEAAARKEVEMEARKEALVEEHTGAPVCSSTKVSSDEDFRGPKKRTQKIDVMGKVSRTADALGLSMRQRAAMTASVLNSVDINLNETNVSVMSAHKKGKENRLRIAKDVKDNFVCPLHVSLHWDGKILTMKGKVKSNRVAIYISGTDSQKVRKVLGIPETKGNIFRSFYFPNC